MSVRHYILALLCIAAVALAEPPVPSPPREHDVVSSPTNAPLKQISEHIFEIGQVKLDKKQRTVSFPATVNMQEGLMEYMLVGESGKIHESVLVTTAEPYHIHIAMLFLGARGAPPLKAEERAVETHIKGEPVALWTAWKSGGRARRARAETFITHKESSQSMSEGPWTYNGSWIFEGTFLAQREKSIIAIVTDHDALINNPRSGRDNDEIWLANKDKIPPPGTMITVTIELSTPPKEATKP